MDWMQDTDDAIRQSDILILIASHASCTSSWVLQELGAARLVRPAALDATRVIRALLAAHPAR
ncbi:MAG TPA: TIR domain-containing protein [Longimicrobium sp.]|nr:TIR domain-containing protein [Longimicrobium sp.]